MAKHSKRKAKIAELLVEQQVINEEELEHILSEMDRTGLDLAQTIGILGYAKEEDIKAMLGGHVSIHEKERLGTLLIKQGLILEQDLEKALEYQKTSGLKLGKSLVALGLVDEIRILEVLSSQLEVPLVKLGHFHIASEVAALIQEDMAKKNNFVPLYMKEGVLTIAMSEPTDLRIVDHIKFRTQMEVEAVLATEEDIHAAIARVYGGSGESLSSLLEDDSGTVEEVAEHDDEGDVELTDEEGQQVVKIVNTIINEAVRKGASDIHLEPQENYLQLRYRVDGALIVNPPIPSRLMSQIISRLKILSKMDIAEKRKPLDGRFTVKVSGKEVDLRVSSFPTALRKRGVTEKIVIRILDPTANKIPLDDMGFDPGMLEQFKKQVHLPNGIILVTGPTGSGKSTTLYAGIKEVNDPSINIVTMEDPVELNLDGVSQGQINNSAGFTFAAGLRAILRQDPDVIMLGEMRDAETAGMAIEAALTGHLVLSTLHTNDSAGAFPRLLEMGLEPFLVASSIEGILAQRLVRKICKSCKQEVEVPANLKAELGVAEDTMFYEGKGCAKCDNTGYKGRCGIYEFLVPNEEVRALVLKRSGSDDIKAASLRQGMITLRQDGLSKAAMGVTTLQEIMTASKSD